MQLLKVSKVSFNLIKTKNQTTFCEIDSDSSNFEILTNLNLLTTLLSGLSNTLHAFLHEIVCHSLSRLRILHSHIAEHTDSHAKHSISDLYSLPPHLHKL